MTIDAIQQTKDDAVFISLQDRAGIYHTFDLERSDIIDLHNRLGVILSESRMQKWHKILPNDRLSDTI